MSEKKAKEPTTAEAAPSVKQYTQLKQQLTQQIIKKQELDAKLQQLEDSIYEKENDYFNESMYGNIIKGFDNFTKANAGGLNKRRITYAEEDHIFSMSSANYVKSLMKRQGLASLGAAVTGKEDFDDYEDSVEPAAPAKDAGGSPAAGNTNPTIPGGTPVRKRKARILDD